MSGSRTCSASSSTRLGWTEIDGEAFAPGFFVWNSEVGRRSFGVQTFWLQAVCQNHIVWDAIEVVEFSRKHTASVTQFVSMRCGGSWSALVQKRDQRKDAFAKVVAKAMQESLGEDADEALKILASHGINRTVGQASAWKSPDNVDGSRSSVWSMP